MGVKVAVIGGGSTYTPELVEGFLDEEERFGIDALVLTDPNSARLEIVGGLAERMLRKRDWTGSFSVTDQREVALDGADFVVVQLRVGGQAARLSDETLPLGHGCFGQETTGPGGFAKALRTVPLILEIAEQSARFAAKDAWLIDFTNPVGIVTQALADEGHRALGLCNVARWVQRRLSHYVGILNKEAGVSTVPVNPNHIDLEHVGLNHLTWVRSAQIDGRDVLPDLLARFGPELALESGSPVELIELLGALPSYYLHYYYEKDHELSQQLQDGYLPRAKVVAELEESLLAKYQDPTLSKKPEELSYRGGAYYSESAVRLMASLHAGTGDIQVVNDINGGAVPGLFFDDVAEIPAVIDCDGAHPVVQRQMPQEMFGLVEHAKAYERLAVKAAMSGSKKTAIRALVANPLVGQYEMARDLAEDIIEENRHFLPRFFPNTSP